MSVFKSFLEQSKELQKQSSASAKIAIAAGAVLCVAMIIGVGIWSSQPNYVPLAQELEPSEAAKVMSKLSNAGIKNKSDYSTVYVDKSQWDKANMLVADIVGAKMVSKNLALPGMIDAQTTQHYLTEHKEHNLSAAVSRFKAVESAVVHLNIAKDELFMRSDQPSTASVLLTLRPNVPFSRESGQAIVSLISNSVKGLSPEDVKVVDTDGNLISGDESHFGSVIEEQYNYRRRIESYLANQAKSVLEARLGPGKAVVRVIADMDFTEKTAVETSHPQSEAKLKETKKKEKTTEKNEPAEGATGTAANLGSSRGRGKSSPVVTENDETEVTYAQGESRTTIVEAPGKIIRLTVAAMVDVMPEPLVAAVDAKADAAETEAAASLAPAEPQKLEPIMTKEDVEELIKAAVGFDSEDRFDEIKVVLTSLKSELDLTASEAPVVPFWETYSEVIRNSSLGVAALVAFAFGLMMLRKMQPVTIVKETDHGRISPDRARRLSEMANLAKQHPEAMASILKSWINDTPQNSNSYASSKSAA